ncbi:MAG: tetratricopeptide repeat protein [Bacteriovoracaceae bacterium]
MSGQDNSNDAVAEALNGTALGAFIAKNRYLVIGLVVVLIVGIFGYGILNEQKKKGLAHNAQLIYDFEQKYYAPLRDKKVAAEEVLTELKKLHGIVKSDPSLLPLMIRLADRFEKLEDLKSAEAVLSLQEFKKNPYREFFYRNRKAEVLEDQGKMQEALQELNKMSPQASMLLEEKVFLDKGRLNLKLGKLAEAEKVLKLLTETKEVRQEEFVRLAQIYLEEIKAKSSK